MFSPRWIKAEHTEPSPVLVTGLQIREGNYTDMGKKYRCPWHIGDIYAYQLCSNLAKERRLDGRYLLVQKIDEEIWYPGHVVPIVYVKITENRLLPRNNQEYDSLPYVQTWFTKYEDRFFPIDGRDPVGDIEKKSQIKYYVDEFGFLPQFRITLVIKSSKDIPASFGFLGNYQNAVRPSKEFVPHIKENIVAVNLTKNGNEFENKLLCRYLQHNLRELSIYSCTN